MLLKNFWEARRVCNNNVIPNTGSYNEPYGDPVDIVDLQGNALGYLNNGKFTNYTNEPYKTQVLHLVNPFRDITTRVGTGNKAVEIDDYALETDVTSSFTGTSTSVAKITNNDGKYQVDIRFSGTNSGSDDIVLTEIGFTQVMGKITQLNQYNGTNVNVMIARYILSEPILVEAGSGVSITIRIEMS